MYRAIAVFDLDNTLLNTEKQISTENLAALKALQEAAVFPVIATGRDRFEIQDVIDAGQFDTIISANGADVYSKGQQLLEHAIAPDLLAQLAQWADAHQTPMAFSDHDGIAINLINSLVETNYSRIHRHTPRIDPTFYQGRAITKVLPFLGMDAADRAQEQALRTTFDQLTFYRDSDVCMDVVASGTNKASGISTLLTTLGNSKLPVYAFGDGHNDIAMLQAATYGIAMGNANATVQANADYVTANFDDGGIVKALRHFKVIA